MKKIIISFILLFATLASAEKAVFDCASGDMNFVQSRMGLIERTAKDFKKNNTEYEFILTVHGGCTLIVDKDHDDEKQMIAIQKKLKTLKEEHNVKIEACGIALNKFGLKKDDILSSVDIVENSITRVITLQNQGYAFVPFH